MFMARQVIEMDAAERAMLEEAAGTMDAGTAAAQAPAGVSAAPEAPPAEDDDMDMDMDIDPAHMNIVKNYKRQVRALFGRCCFVVGCVSWVVG